MCDTNLTIPLPLECCSGLYGGCEGEVLVWVCLLSCLCTNSLISYFIYRPCKAFLSFLNSRQYGIPICLYCFPDNYFESVIKPNVFPIYMWVRSLRVGWLRRTDKEVQWWWHGLSYLRYVLNLFMYGWLYLVGMTPKLIMYFVCSDWDVIARCLCMYV